MTATFRPALAIADWVAVLLSGVTSPFVTICACALWVIRASAASTAEFVRLSVPFVALVALPPVVYVLAGVTVGRVTDVHVQRREQRAGPFAIATVGSAVLAVAWARMGAPHELTALAANLVVSGLLFAGLTSRWKLSIHTGAFAAAVLIVSLLIDRQLLALYAALPLVVWGRVRRGRHTVWQAVAAAALAAATSLATLTVMGVR